MKRNVLQDGNNSGLVMIEGLGEYAPMAMVAELKFKIERLQAQNKNLYQEAVIHAHEARAQRSTVHDIYQALGIQKGDWNGKVPVVEAFNKLQAEISNLTRDIQERDSRAHIISPQVFEEVINERDRLKGALQSLKREAEQLSKQQIIAAGLIRDCVESENEFKTDWDTQAANWLFTVNTDTTSHDAKVIESLRFPAALRKMWSGGEVQQWLKQQADLIREQTEEAQS